MSESVSAQGMLRKSVAQGGLVPEAQPGLSSPQPDWKHSASFLPCTCSSDATVVIVAFHLCQSRPAFESPTPGNSCSSRDGSAQAQLRVRSESYPVQSEARKVPPLRQREHISRELGPVGVHVLNSRGDVGTITVQVDEHLRVAGLETAPARRP